MSQSPSVLGCQSHWRCFWGLFWLSHWSVGRFWWFQCIAERPYTSQIPASEHIPLSSFCSLSNIYIRLPPSQPLSELSSTWGRETKTRVKVWNSVLLHSFMLERLWSTYNVPGTVLDIEQTPVIQSLTSLFYAVEIWKMTKQLQYGVINSLVINT